MIIIHLTGGLGNQMFQYAAARALQIKKNCVCKFYFKDSYKDATRKYQLDIFNLIIENASKSEIHSYNPVIGLRNKWKLLFRKKMQYPVYYEKKQFNFDPNFFNCSDNCLISGFWQSEQYFIDIAAVIRHEFTFVPTPNEINTKYINEIKACNSISVHIRRTDYINSIKTNKIHGVCSYEYYENAINHIVENISNPVFYFFSDDIEWTKSTFENSKYISQFISHNSGSNDYEDMRLMSNCKHHIIANSSFSWWGAWLNPQNDKIVITPKKWVNDIDISIVDLIPKNWVKL